MTHFDAQLRELMDLEPLPGAQYLHALGSVAETDERVAVSFGPEYTALEQRQVEIIKNEAVNNRCLAVKIIENRGIESLKVIRLD